MVKTNTKEKFHVITVSVPSLSADMAAELSNLLLPYLQNDVKNIILNLKELQSLDEIAVGSSRVDLQACKLEYSIVSPK